MTRGARLRALLAAAPEATHDTPARSGRPALYQAPDFELIMPAQWFAGGGDQAAAQPEKRLMFAVLCDAIEIVLNDGHPADPRRAALLRPAVRWIGSNDRLWAYSFLNVCEALELEAERVRRGIARLRERRRRGRSIG